MLKRVLIVDDAELVHKMYQFFLKKYQGCVIVPAKNGREALEKLEQSNDFDLILLDVNMPVMNGIQFLKTIMADPRHRHLPVIIISTEGKEEDTCRALSMGARGYLVKPFNAQGLTAIIEKVLAAPRLVPAPAVAPRLSDGAQ